MTPEDRELIGRLTTLLDAQRQAHISALQLANRHTTADRSARNYRMIATQLLAHQAATERMLMQRLQRSKAAQGSGNSGLGPVPKRPLDYDA